jgi:hypothetical protein
MTDADRFFRSVLAGFAGTTAHVVLMFVKDRLHILPAFQPYDEFQHGLSMLTGTSVSAPVAWLLTFLNGAVLWGFVFGRVYRALPGATPLRKGLFFALCAWVVSGFVFFPLMGRGPFAIGLGLGSKPAALMLVMLSVYSLSMSFAYHALMRRAGAVRP